MMKRYSELIQIESFDDRLKYLQCKSLVGDETLAQLRWMCQELYHSPDWLAFRRSIILRDECCDLAHPDFPLDGYFDAVQNKMLNPHKITVHHIVPLTAYDLVNNTRRIFDPENVITTCGNTHRFIHYGIPVSIPTIIERAPNDTCPWKR